MRNRALFLVALGLVAGVASAQKLVFNFEKIEGADRPTHSSSTGYVLMSGTQGYSVWNKKTGRHLLEGTNIPFATTVINKVANDGSVYGNEGENLVKWNALGQKSTIGPLNGLVLVDVKSNGKVLLTNNSYEEEYVGNGYNYDLRRTRYSTIHEFDPSTGAISQITDKMWFTPRRYGPNGMIVGSAGEWHSIGYPSQSSYGVLKTLFPEQAYEDAGSSQSGISSTSSFWRNMYFLNDGSRVLGSTSSYQSHIGGSDFHAQTLYSPTGEMLSEYTGGYGIFNNPTFETYASGGFSFGKRSENLTTKIAQYMVGKQAYDIDSSSYEVGSEIISEFLPDNFADSGYLLATTGGYNNESYYIGTYRFDNVPEPMTIAALGLGSAALLRRRKKRQTSKIANP